MPVRNYRQISTGKQVKGVTTILSILSKPALIFWGYKQGMSNFDRLMGELALYGKNILGQPLQIEDIENLIKNFQTTGLYDKRDKAANAGTLAHSFVENHLKGLPEPSKEGLSKEVIDKAEGCYLTFLDWEKANIKKVIGSEIEITSEDYPFGGTIDHVIQSPLTPDGKVDILDIKTGKDIYLEAKIQVRAYKALYNESKREKNYIIEEDIVAGFHILRLGENGEFTHKYFPSLDEGYFKVFLDLLDVTETLSQLGEKL